MTRRVGGAHTVAQNLAVTILPEHAHSDSDIAAAINDALLWNVYVPKTVTVQVQQGSVRLEGQVNWNYQRSAAEHAVRFLAGVVAVHNLITVKPQAVTLRENGKAIHFWARWASYFRAQPSAKQIRAEVLAALQRQATTDATSIHVNTQDTKVTLTGHASSLQFIVDAANAAWSAPGVTHVINRVKLAQS